MTAATAVAAAMLLTAAFLPPPRTGRDRWRQLTTAVTTAPVQESRLRSE